MSHCKLFVYGTLKAGKRLHTYLKTSKYLGECIINNYTLYDSGFGYPYAVKDLYGKVKGEVYLVDKDTFYKIYDVEIPAGYKLERLPSEYGILGIYVYDRNKVDLSKHIGEVFV